MKYPVTAGSVAKLGGLVLLVASVLQIPALLLSSGESARLFTASWAIDWVSAWVCGPLGVGLLLCAAALALWPRQPHAPTRPAPIRPSTSAAGAVGALLLLIGLGLQAALVVSRFVLLGGGRYSLELTAALEPLIDWLATWVCGTLGVGLVLTAIVLRLTGNPRSAASESAGAPQIPSAVGRIAVRGAICLALSLVVQVLVHATSSGVFTGTAWLRAAAMYSASTLDWLSSWVGALLGVGLLLSATVCAVRAAQAAPERTTTKV